MPLGLKPESVPNWTVVNKELEKKNSESRRRWEEKYGPWFTEADERFRAQVAALKQDEKVLMADAYVYRPVFTRPQNLDRPEEGLFKPNDYSIPKAFECPSW